MTIFFIDESDVISRGCCQCRTASCLVPDNLAGTAHQVCRKNFVTSGSSIWRYVVLGNRVRKVWGRSRNEAARIAWGAHEGAV